MDTSHPTPSNPYDSPALTTGPYPQPFLPGPPGPAGQVPGSGPSAWADSPLPLRPHIEAQMPGPAAASVANSAQYVPQYPPPPSTQQQMGVGPMPGSSQALSPLVSSAHDIRAVRTGCQFSLREYLTLRNKRGRLGAGGSTTSLDLEEQVRAQARIAAGDLRVLREELGIIVREAERHRWRRWLLGGLIGSFIPMMKRLFRRTSGGRDVKRSTANDTEYAFLRSRSLLSRMQDAVTGRGWWSLAFFVSAVLFVFQNEVTLRVAKTVSKRVKRLASRLERLEDGGSGEVGEGDMKLLEGWRWRVLQFGR